MLVGMGFMSTSFATSAEPTIPTFCLKSATANGLETQPNLLETCILGESKYEKSANGKHFYEIYPPSYTYGYWYSLPVPEGDRLDVMLPTYGAYNSKVEWVGNKYPEFYPRDRFNCTGISTKRINNTEYTIYSFKTINSVFSGLSFHYRANGPNQQYYTRDGGPLTKFSVWLKIS